MKWFFPLRSVRGLALLVGLWAILLPVSCSRAGPGGFDLSGSLISRSAIHSGGPGKDGIPALTDPPFVDPAEADYLNPKDLVIGVTSAGQAKAYPLRILIWHEIANDTIGGRPIAITYCPLCQSVLVFDRRVGGEVRTFGVSGLLYNSNVLMYDRQNRARDESLWSQGEMRAVTGPAAKEGLELSLLPAELTSWSDWAARHPSTRVLSEETGYQRSYRREAYASYFDSDRLMFPVDLKTERPDGFEKKELLVVVYTDRVTRAYALNDVKKAAGNGGVMEDLMGDRVIRFSYVSSSDTVRVEAADQGPPPDVAYMFWFALSALQPEVELYRPE